MSNISSIQLANTLKQAKITTNGRKMLLCLGKRNGTFSLIILAPFTIKLYKFLIAILASIY